MSHSGSGFNSMKFRLWRRRMSVSAPKLAIRTQASWPARILIAVLIGALSAFAMWAYDSGRFSRAQPDDLRAQLDQYKEQLDKLTEERDRLSTTANAAESQLTIEKSAQKQLAAQVKALNGKVKHFFHLAAIYDVTVDAATQRAADAD